MKFYFLLNGFVILMRRTFEENLKIEIICFPVIEKIVRVYFI